LLLSIPVSTTRDRRVAASINLPANTTLKPGESYSTPRTFVAVYKGDYYEPLSMWSNAVEREGLPRPTNNNENYAVSWCGWGYESNVTPVQMLATVSGRRWKVRIRRTPVHRFGCGERTFRLAHPE
jgi:alpha-galactosidase